MIVVTVARKPLAASSVAASVLEHGTGALNIDATRISPASGDAYAGLTVGSGDPGALNPGCGPSFPHHKENWGAWTAKAEGRWPANLILEHKPECRMVGTKQAGSGKFVGPEEVRRTSEMMTSAKGWNANSLDNSKKNAPNSYGTEVVEAWECAPGCPIAHLDATTSASVTGNRSPTSQAAKVEGTTWGTDNHKSREYPNETGSVSRFFKRVKR